MGDTLDLDASLDAIAPRSALIVGAGYVGLEMAEGLTARGIAVTQVEMLPEVLPTVDPELGALVHAELDRHGVNVHTRTTVTRVQRADNGYGPAARRRHRTGRPTDSAGTSTWSSSSSASDPTPTCSSAPARRPAPAAPSSSTSPWPPGCPTVWAAGDCVVTHHRQLGVTYLPLGTTAHKQGRVAGENAIGGQARFAGILGTQVVKVFDLVAARTGLRDPRPEPPATTPRPSSPRRTTTRPTTRVPTPSPSASPATGRTGRLLGAQLVGRRGTETAKRVDTYATALFHTMTVDDVTDLDLSYTPPLGSPWDAVQVAGQALGP